MMYLNKQISSTKTLPVKSASKFLRLKVERKYAAHQRHSHQPRSWWHVSELVEHHQVMQKEHQKQQQKNIAKTEKIVDRGKNKVHDQRRREIEFFYQRH